MRYTFPRILFRSFPHSNNSLSFEVYLNFHERQNNGWRKVSLFYGIPCMAQVGLILVRPRQPVSYLKENCLVGVSYDGLVKAL